MTAVAPYVAGLRRIWEALPSGPLTERQLDEQIIKAAGAYEGDFAYASAIRTSLVAGQVFEVRQVEGSRDVTYERAARWVDPPANGPGTDAFNAELRRQHESDLRELDAQRAREFEDSPWVQQRRQLIELVDARVAEKFAELMTSLDDDLIARVRARVHRDTETTETETE